MIRLFISVVVFLLSLSPVSFAQAIQSQQKRFSAEDFARLPFMFDPDLSPDGRKIAARIAVNDEQMLGILDLDNPGPPVVLPMRDNDLIRWRWVNDDWLVVHLGDKGIIDSFPLYITRVVTIRADGKQVRAPGLREPGQNADFIWTATDGSPRFLMAAQKSIFEGLDFWPAVVEVDASTGRGKQVVDPVTGVMTWYADAEGVVRIGYGFDNRFEQRRVLYRSSGKERFRILDRKTFDQDRSMITPVVLPASTGQAYVFSDHEGYDWLYAFDQNRLGPGNSALKVPGYDLDEVYISRGGERIIGVGFSTNRWRMQWTDPKFASVQAGIEKSAAPGEWVRIISWDREETRFLVWIGNASQAGRYHLYDTTTGQLRMLGYANDRFRDQVFGTVSTIRYKARDGLEIPAVLTLPGGREPKNLPLILLPHGGPNVRDVEGWDYWAQFLSYLGYAVIQPNYRGSTGYGRAFADAGDGEWGLKMQDDLNDAVDHLVGKGIADPARVCILGGSYGGYAAMRGATRDGARFRCAISVNGVADLVALNRYDRSALFGGKFTDRWLRKRAYDLEGVSPINQAASAATPILLIHGKKDLRVPVDQSRDFARALEKAGKMVRYVEMPEADHGLSRGEDRVTFLTEVEAFLTRYNPVN